MDQTIIGSNRKIDPTRRAHLKPDLTPDDNDRVEIGPTDLAFAEWAAAGLRRRTCRRFVNTGLHACGNRFAGMTVQDC